MEDLGKPNGNPLVPHEGKHNMSIEQYDSRQADTADQRGKEYLLSMPSPPNPRTCMPLASFDFGLEFQQLHRLSTERDSKVD